MVAKHFETNCRHSPAFCTADTRCSAAVCREESCTSCFRRLDDEACDLDYRQYLATTTVSGDEVLDDWRWLTGSALQLWKVTKMGDAFLRDPEDGSIHFLDVISGKVERIAENESDFEAAIAVPENAERWFMPDVVNGQAALGMRLKTDECLSFKTPPCTGRETFARQLRDLQRTRTFFHRRAGARADQGPADCHKNQSSQNSRT